MALNTQSVVAIMSTGEAASSDGKSAAAGLSGSASSTITAGSAAITMAVVRSDPHAKQVAISTNSLPVMITIFLYNAGENTRTDFVWRVTQEFMPCINRKKVLCIVKVLMV